MVGCGLKEQKPQIHWDLNPSPTLLNNSPWNRKPKTKEMYSLTLLRFQSPKVVLLSRNPAPSWGLGVNGCFAPPASRGFGFPGLMVASLQSAMWSHHIASFVWVCVCVCMCRPSLCLPLTGRLVMRRLLITFKAHKDNPENHPQTLTSSHLYPLPQELIVKGYGDHGYLVVGSWFTLPHQ